MKIRVRRDRHFLCAPGRCVAPRPSDRRLQGRPVGACKPRRVFWLLVNRGGKRQAFAFQAEEEAVAAMAKLRAAETLGQRFLPTAAIQAAPTFKDIAESALALYAKTNNLGPATLKNHVSYVRKHLVPAFGPRPVSPETFNRLTIREFIAAQRELMQDSTLRSSLPTLSICLDHAVEKGLLVSNPLRGGGRLWRPKAPEAVTPFTPEQVRDVLAHASAVDHDFGVLVRVMFQTGIRPGEGLGVRRCDLDLDRAELHVEGSWSHNMLGPTKTRKTRVVSLLFPVAETRPIWRPEEAGHETRKVLDGLRGLKVLPADPEGRVWSMSSTKFDRLWRRTLKRAGLAWKKPHTTRHTFASVLLSRGGNVFRVQEAGGWRSATVLLNTYTKWIREAAACAPDASTGTGTKPTESTRGQ